jgi:RNA polymerase sigma factor for flagellar operon FliA
MTDLAETWAEYGATRSPVARDALILAYRPLVRYVAARLAQGLPASVEVQDLASYGVFGLIDAIEKYEIGRVKFETYAIQRIRGAILDELRALDWAPRSVRSKARAIERELSRLEHELGRTPSEEELATAVGVSAQDLRRSLSQLRLAQTDSLDRSVAGPDDTGSTLADRVEDRSDITLTPQMEEAGRLLSEGIARLPDRERTFMALYYFEGLTLADIGVTLRVSESRVCQLHTRAAVALQRILAGQLV